jgi:predicted lipid-binding transport protein (Tim44 family)
MSKAISKNQRVVIYAKDIVTITGRKITTARTLYRSILQAFGKQPGQFITLREFCIYTGISEDVAKENLQ